MGSTQGIPDDIGGVPVESTEGGALGYVSGAYTDAEGKPRAAVVAFHDGTEDAVVPLIEASFRNGTIRVGYTEEAVRSTPAIEIEESLRKGAMETIDKHFQETTQNRLEASYEYSSKPPPAAYPYRPMRVSSLADFVVEDREGLIYRAADKWAPDAERG
jgi:hypothetical protein